MNQTIKENQLKVMMETAKYVKLGKLDTARSRVVRAGIALAPKEPGYSDLLFSILLSLLTRYDALRDQAILTLDEEMACYDAIQSAVDASIRSLRDPFDAKDFLRSYSHAALCVTMTSFVAGTEDRTVSDIAERLGKKEEEE